MAWAEEEEESLTVPNDQVDILASDCFSSSSLHVSLLPVFDFHSESLSLLSLIHHFSLAIIVLSSSLFCLSRLFLVSVAHVHPAAQK